MIIIKSLMKVLLFPLLLFLSTLQVLFKIGIRLSSAFLGLLTFFIFICILLTIVKQQWSQTFLLVLIDCQISYVHK